MCSQDTLQCLTKALSIAQYDGVTQAFHNPLHGSILYCFPTLCLPQRCLCCCLSWFVGQGARIQPGSDTCLSDVYCTRSVQHHFPSHSSCSFDSNCSFAFKLFKLFLRIHSIQVVRIIFTYRYDLMPQYGWLVLTDAYSGQASRPQATNQSSAFWSPAGDAVGKSLIGIMRSIRRYRHCTCTVALSCKDPSG